MKNPLTGLARALRHFFDRFQFSTGGLVACEAARGKWRVLYSDGTRSIPMAHGTAKDYASMFGGSVVHLDDSPPDPA